MLSSKQVNFFLSAAFFSVLFSSCSWFEKKENRANSNSVAAAAEEIPTDIPFSTKEPENYQAEIVVTTQANGENPADKMFVARSGQRQLLITDFGEKHAVSFLKTADKSYLSSAGARIYAEVSDSAQVYQSETAETKISLFTDFLNEKFDARFEKIGVENNLAKYRILLGDGKSSETFIYIDETLNIPVKQEVFSISGEQKKMLFSVEVLNFKPQADENNFSVPKDFKKVSINDFRRSIARRQIK